MSFDGAVPSKEVDRVEPNGGLAMIGVDCGACVGGDPRSMWFELGVWARQSVASRPRSRVDRKVWADSSGFLMQLGQKNAGRSVWMVVWLPRWSSWLAGKWGGLTKIVGDVADVGAHVLVLDVFPENVSNRLLQVRSFANCSSERGESSAQCHRFRVKVWTARGGDEGDVGAFVLDIVAGCLLDACRQLSLQIFIQHRDLLSVYSFGHTLDSDMVHFLRMC